MIGLINEREVAYGFVGLRDVNQNDVMVFIGSGTVLPDSSDLWGGSFPSHTHGRDCVAATKYYNGKLRMDTCTYPYSGYICEKY